MRRPFSEGSAQGPGPDDRRDVYRRVVAKEQPGAPEANGPYERLASAIFEYNIFPPSLIAAVLARVPIEIGDVVGVCYLAPFRLRLFFAARVVETFHGASEAVLGYRAGFTYRTLEGHPELGEETFGVHKRAETGEVSVELASWSRPGIWATKLASGWLRRIQVRASQGALKHLSDQAAASP